jgi:hypothetical protein
MIIHERNTSMMTLIIDWLKHFNSKERFFLINEITGSFQPSHEFLCKLGGVLQLTIPDTVFFATDYHLDWIYASLELAQQKIHPDNKSMPLYLNSKKFIKAQQEDVDVLIAYFIEETCHLIMIEAKGVIGWNNVQMSSKANRLREIFGDNELKLKNVQPHFVIMSPNKPKNLNFSEYPSWLKATNDNLTWLPLSIPKGLKRVFRCDMNGKENKMGGYWTIKNRT